MGEAKVVCLFYADDLILFDEDLAGLKELLEAVLAECDKSGLAVNYEKTVFRAFRAKGRLRPTPTLQVRGREIRFEADMVKYLRGLVRFDGGFARHIAELRKKGQRALGALCAIWRRFPAMTSSFQLSLTSALHQPVISYACETWGATPQPALERQEETVIRRILGVSQRVAGAAVRWVCGRAPLHSRLLIQIYG